MRYRERNLRRYFRGDAAFAAPGIYDYLEAEGFLHAIRLPTNQVLQQSIGHLLTRPIGRPPNHVRRYYASFSYQAGSWDRKRRVVAKVEWHPGDPNGFSRFKGEANQSGLVLSDAGPLVGGGRPFVAAPLRNGL